MSTRSRIAIKNADKTITSVYCHSDGYLEYVGKMLLEHYKDRAKVNALIALGALSSLAEEIGEKHSFELRGQGVVTAYTRDRGEEFQQETAKDVAELVEQANDSDGEYVYLFKGRTWYLVDPKTKDLLPLSKIFKMKNRYEYKRSFAKKYASALGGFLDTLDQGGN